VGVLKRRRGREAGRGRYAAPGPEPPRSRPARERHRARRATPELAAKPRSSASFLAERGCVVVCGAARRHGGRARGAKRRGGSRSGSAGTASAPPRPHYACAAHGLRTQTQRGQRRRGDALAALGTLSEIALARNVGKPVILLDTGASRRPNGGSSTVCGGGSPPRPRAGAARVALVWLHHSTRHLDIGRTRRPRQDAQVPIVQSTWPLTPPPTLAVSCPPWNVTPHDPRKQRHGAPPAEYMHLAIVTIPLRIHDLSEWGGTPKPVAAKFRPPALITYLCAWTP